MSNNLEQLTAKHEHVLASLGAAHATTVTKSKLDGYIFDY